MGDNIWLGDRDGVRTPMQWTPDRNAGFSSCDPGRMSFPTIMDPVYGYQVTNVEAPDEPASLLHWTQADDRDAQAEPGLRPGHLHRPGREQPAVLAFVRAYGDDVVLCVNNFSRFAQPTELDLRPYEGRQPVELTRRRRASRAIGELPYLLTLAGHGFYWFRAATEARRERHAGPPSSSEERLPSADELAEFLSAQRWFSGRGRQAR